MKRETIFPKEVFKGQEINLIYTLGDGFVLENADAVAATVHVQGAPGDPVALTTTKAGLNIIETTVPAEQTATMAKDAEIVVTVTVAGAEHASIIAKVSSDETRDGAIRMAIPLYTKELTNPFAG